MAGESWDELDKFLADDQARHASGKSEHEAAIRGAAEADKKCADEVLTHYRKALEGAASRLKKHRYEAVVGQRTDVGPVFLTLHVGRQVGVPLGALLFGCVQGRAVAQEEIGAAAGSPIKVAPGKLQPVARDQVNARILEFVKRALGPRS